LIVALLIEGVHNLFTRLETLGEMAFNFHNQPDSGPWETRNILRINTFSSIMCWAACDRLAKIAVHIGLTQKAVYWRKKADQIHATICARAWNEKNKPLLVSLRDDRALDATLLLLHDIGFLPADDPRFAKTVAAIERELKRGNYISVMWKPMISGFRKTPLLSVRAGTSMLWLP